MAAFLSKLLNVPTEKKSKEFRDPVFLLGLMRSGTTLLMHTLSEHPQLLKVGFELNKMWTEVGGAPCKGSNCPYVTEQDYKQQNLKNVVNYFSDYIASSKSFIRLLSRIDQRRVHGSGGVFYDWDNAYPLNKSPHLSNKVRYITKMFPNAKIIVIVRPIYAQVASLKKHFEIAYQEKDRDFYLPDEENACWSVVEKDNEKLEAKSVRHHFETIPEAWIRLNYIMLKDLEQIGIPHLVVNYNDLIVNQSTILKKIFSFLDLKKEHRSKENKIISKKRKIHNTTTKGNPLEKWKKTLTEEEKTIIENTIKKEQESYNYILNKPLSL